MLAACAREMRGTVVEMVLPNETAVIASLASAAGEARNAAVATVLLLPNVLMLGLLPARTVVAVDLRPRRDSLTDNGVYLLVS